MAAVYDEVTFSPSLKALYLVVSGLLARLGHADGLWTCLLIEVDQKWPEHTKPPDYLGYRQRGSLQLFSSLNTASTRSLPQILLPALLGCSRKA